jgi:Family of unknown function (DUF5329)
MSVPSTHFFSSTTRCSELRRAWGWKVHLVSEAAQDMHLILSRALLVAMLLLTETSYAAPGSPVVRAEIDALIKKLKAPGCEFNRNGSWYSGTEAQMHLSRKLEYLEGKNLIKTTEDFISLGAATSSSSGKAYMVRCGEASPIESKTWLQDQLKTLRQAK